MSIRMKFVNRELSPEKRVIIRLEQDEMHLDVKMNGVLVGFFADGVLHLCTFGPASKAMYGLEAEGVRFEKRTKHNDYIIQVNR